MLLFLLSLVLLVTTTAYSSFSMIVTYGKAINSTASSLFPTNSWEECVLQCYQSVSCVLADSPADPIDCKLYNVGKVFEVQKLQPVDDFFVAFKVLNEQNTCPIGDNPPTFGNSTNYGSVSNSVADYAYEINYSSQNTWTMSYTATAVCSDGWTQFTRPTTNWCIQVVGGPAVTYTQAQALADCEAVGATLTGLETTEERNFIANTGVELLGSAYTQFAGFWISGMRKPECYADGWESISYCTGGDLQQFSYSDTYLTNYGGFNWDPEQPDRNKNGPWANCIQIWIRPLFPTLDYVNYANGNVDDAVCDVVDYDRYHLRGYACGKLPEVPVGAF